MIRPGILIRGKITPTIDLKGKTNASIIREYPELENVEIKPTTEEQILKSEKYGFDEVKILGVTAEIDKNIKSENIKVGVSILDVEGGYEGIDTSDATATPSDILIGKTAYADNKKIEGAIEKYDGAYSGDVSEEVQITNASYLFYKGARIDNMDKLLKICKKVISTSNMFNNCQQLKSLDLSNFDASNVTDMSAMFSGCEQLRSLDLSNFDTSNVTNMTSMFGNCLWLDNLDLSNFDTSNVTDMTSMFASCLQLKSLDLSNFDASNVTKISNMFYDYFGLGLTNLKFMKNLGKCFSKTSNNYYAYELDLSKCNLTYESLIDVINNLYDLNLTYNVANGGTLYRQSLKLGTTNIAKLTEEEIAIATNKGWNVS